MSSMSDLALQIGTLLDRHDRNKERLSDEKEQLTRAEEVLRDASSAHDVIQQVALDTQSQAHEQIGRLCSQCLRDVFDEPYELKIVFERKRGKTEARLVFLRDDREFDPLSSSGGGVVDVAAFGLRISAIVLSRPSLRRLVILDEPFRFVSVKYRERVRRMLQDLSDEIGVQFVIVTHINEIMTGKIIHL